MMVTGLVPLLWGCRRHENRGVSVSSIGYKYWETIKHFEVFKKDDYINHYGV